jgi:hypothetical protein
MAAECGCVTTSTSSRITDDQNKRLTVSRRDGTEQPPPLPEAYRPALPAILIDGDESNAPSTETAQAEAIQDGPASGEQTSPTVAANLYVFARDEVEGPFSLEQLQALLQANTVSSATPCCEGGAESWKTVGDYVTSTK